MQREKKLAKNTIIITIGKMCTQLITFLLLPLYTGILTTSEYGVVDLLNTLVCLCLPIVTFQIEQAIFRELIETRGKENDQKHIISSGVLTVITQVLVFSFIFLIISTFIKNNYKYFLLYNVIIHIFLSLFLQISRGFGDNKNYALGSFISAIFTIIFNIIFLVVFRLGAYGMLFGTMLGQLLATIFLFFKLKIKKYVDFHFFRKNIVKKLWKYSIPLIPDAISWWIFNASDKVIVSSIMGVDQNGILAAALKFSIIFTTLNSFFNMSWIESVAMANKDEDFSSYFNKVFNIVIRFFISFALIMIAVMPFVFPLLIKEKFLSGYVIVPISILAAFFDVYVCQISAIFVAKKNTKILAKTSMFAAIINIIIHLSLINFVGLYAAVISTLTSFFIMSILRTININKNYFRIKFDSKVIIYSCILFALITYTYYYNNLFLNILSCVIILLYSFYINKNTIITLFKYVLGILHNKKNK